MICDNLGFSMCHFTLNSTLNRVCFHPDAINTCPFKKVDIDKEKERILNKGIEYIREENSIGIGVGIDENESVYSSSILEEIIEYYKKYISIILDTPLNLPEEQSKPAPINGKKRTNRCIQNGVYNVKIIEVKSFYVSNINITYVICGGTYDGLEFFENIDFQKNEKDFRDILNAVGLKKIYYLKELINQEFRVKIINDENKVFIVNHFK